MTVPVVSKREITTNYPEETIECPDNSRPPKPVETTLDCLDIVTMDSTTNLNGIGTPGDKFEWVHEEIDQSTSCPSPYRKKKTPVDKGCTQNGQPCGDDDGDDDGEEEEDAQS